MKNEYQNLMSHIHAPEDLKRQVLQAARKTKGKAPGMGSVKWGKGRALWTYPAFRAAVCCICALVLLLCSVTLSVPGSGIDATAPPQFSFGVVAYAADTGRVTLPRNSKVVFDLADGGSFDAENGGFTGCLFRVTGEHIQRISASIDRGGLYRMKTVSVNRTTKEGEAAYLALSKGEDPQLEGASTVMVHSMDGDIMDFDACWTLGDHFSEDFNPENSYGFWVSPEAVKANSPVDEEDIAQEVHHDIDTFDGATLSLKVTFTDGSEQTKTLHLHTGKLAVSYPDENGGPQLTGELADESEPYSYGVYAQID